MAAEEAANLKTDKVSSDETDADLHLSLMSMENIDRSSPELWTEKFPGISAIVSQANTKPPYSKEFTNEDLQYMAQLSSLPPAALISKVKELHDHAYQLGLEEAKEMARGKYLNIFKKNRNGSK